MQQNNAYLVLVRACFVGGEWAAKSP